MKRVTVEDTLEMPVDERLALLEGIWESLSATPSVLPVTAPQRSELDRRIALHEQNAITRPWAEVKARLSGRE